MLMVALDDDGKIGFRRLREGIGGGSDDGGWQTFPSSNGSSSSSSRLRTSSSIGRLRYTCMVCMTTRLDRHIIFIRTYPQYTRRFGHLPPGIDVEIIPS